MHEWSRQKLDELEVWLKIWPKISQVSTFRCLQFSAAVRGFFCFFFKGSGQNVLYSGIALKHFYSCLWVSSWLFVAYRVLLSSCVKGPCAEPGTAMPLSL